MFARTAATARPTRSETAKKPAIASDTQTQTDIVSPVSARARRSQSREIVRLRDNDFTKTLNKTPKWPPITRRSWPGARWPTATWSAPIPRQSKPTLGWREAGSMGPRPQSTCSRADGLVLWTRFEHRRHIAAMIVEALRARRINLATHLRGRLLPHLAPPRRRRGRPTRSVR